MTLLRKQNRNYFRYAPLSLCTMFSVNLQTKASAGDPELERRPLDVRYDPFDAGIAYAFVRGQWVQCHSEYYAVLHGRSEKEIILATKELRRRSQLHSAQFSATAHQLAAFLRSVEAEEVLLSQRLRDHASQAIRAEGVINKLAPFDQSSAHDKATVTSTAEQMIGECKIYGEL